jgi:Ran GTPase-activating protein (RanGAP) involved in mRNA processing and transport
LDLRGNHLTSFGLLAIARGLRYNKVLKVISLECNGISEDENRMFVSEDATKFQYYQKDFSLTTEHSDDPNPYNMNTLTQLTSNYISITENSDNTSYFRPLCSNAFQTLKDTISIWGSLSVLNLRGNEIGNQAGTIILEILQSRKSLLENYNVSNTKKIQPLTVIITEKMNADIFEQILEAGKSMQPKKDKSRKSKGGKKEK